MRDVVICEPLRTPVGAFAGGFKNVAPETLATAVVKKIMENSGFPAELGCLKKTQEREKAKSP